MKEAKQEIENLASEKAQAELSKGNAILIDLRESEELKQSGKILSSRTNRYAGILWRSFTSLSQAGIW